MGISQWYQGKKQAFTNWRASRNTAQPTPRNSSMRLNLAPQQPSRWQRTKNWFNAKETAIGIGIAGLGSSIWNKLTAKNTSAQNNLQFNRPVVNRTTQSINWFIIISLLYYFFLDFYLSFPSLAVRFFMNLLFIIFFYYVLFDASERDATTLRQLFIIGIFLEFLLPWAIANYYPVISWVVYLLPWWFLYAVMIRGRDNTRFSKFFYFFTVIYIIGLFFVAATMLLSFVTGSFNSSNPVESVATVLGSNGLASGTSGTSGNPFAVLFRAPENEDSRGRAIAASVFQKTFTWWEDFFVLVKNSVVSVKSFTQSQIDQATGAEYYTGQVEDNKNLPLGVTLEDVKAADTEYEQGEAVTVYGTVKTRTLNDAVTIRASCYKGDPESKSSDSSGTFREGIIQPNYKFTVYDLDQEDIDCKFDKGHPALVTDMKSGGSFKVTLAATFNFETVGYLKSYFMDNERLRSMKRSNIDPFVVFNIQDKKPEAIFTPGPVKLGLGMKDPPIGVVSAGGDDQQTFRIGVTVDNNLGWKGKIKKINQVVLYLPPGVDFDLTTCNVPFIEYSQQQCEQTLGQDITDQKESKVYKNCIEEKKGSVSGKEECIKEVCMQEFYTENNQKVKAYQVDTAQLPAEVLQNLKSYKTFSCRAKVSDAAQLLGTTPLSIRYAKAKVKYDYTVEQSTNVKIKAIPLVETVKVTTTTISMSTTVIKTQILGYKNQIPGDLEGYAITADNQIPVSALGKEIQKLAIGHRLDQQTSNDITGIFTYYDINNDSQADMIIVTEFFTDKPNEIKQKYLLIAKDAKYHDFVVEKLKQYIDKKADEVNGDIRVIKN